MSLSGWCQSLGFPDQWHDACRSTVCACPNRANDEKKED